ncbi:MAG: antibiotic biosynthesis monooxygenase [Clostridiales bacterium]|jgi:quinol monooxygenase YgiN|nr:antibiotic biosynthesis monooxygenase [Clostridiales bacterium]
MVKVVANNYVRKECVDEYLRLGKEIVEKTNALDKGCIKYELCRSVQDPLHFAMLEEWESMADLEAHMQSDHFKELIPQINSLVSKEGAISLFEKVW